MTKLQRRLHCYKHAIVFAVVNEKGGLHYHRNHVSPEVCGIESHSPAVNGDKCWLLGGPCEHDGSTLQARERWNPIFEHCNETGNFEPLWYELEKSHGEVFGGTP